MATIDAIAKQRTAEAAGAEVAYAPYVPQVGDNSAPRDLQEAADYYLTRVRGIRMCRTRCCSTRLVAGSALMPSIW